MISGCTKLGKKWVFKGLMLVYRGGTAHAESTHPQSNFVSISAPRTGRYIHSYSANSSFLYLFLTNRKWNSNFPRQRKLAGHNLQKRNPEKSAPSLWDHSASKRGSLAPHYHQHLFAGLSKTAHPQPLHPRQSAF